MNFIILIKAIIYNVSRRTYSLYRFSRIKFGHSTKIQLPLKVGGKGKIIFGNNTVFNKGVYLSAFKKTKIEFGNDCSLGKNVLIESKKNSGLIGGNKISIGQATKLYIHNAWSFGNSIKIASHCQIYSREIKCYGKLKIEGECFIGDGTILDISDDIIIGKNVAIGPQCILYTHDHNYKENLDIPWKGKPITTPIVIEDGAWIGAGVIILPGVTIGKSAIIAARTVVTKDIPPYTINAGIPAKVIRHQKPVLHNTN